MKLTKADLKRIIAEETARLNEVEYGDPEDMFIAAVDAAWNAALASGQRMGVNESILYDALMPWADKKGFGGY